MKTIKSSLLITILCFLFIGINTQGQTTLGKRIKKKLEDKVVETVDRGLSEKEKRKRRREERRRKKDREISTNQEVVIIEKSIPIKNFINSNLRFTDNFDNEKPREFPSRWSLVKGTIQNDQIVVLGKREGVAKFITSGTLKPTFKNDHYLGDSFKLEIQCLFRENGGNQAYTLNLMNKNDVYGAYKITIRGDGIVPAGGSSEYARLPYKLPNGWRTIQLSFNKGILKVFYEGYQLINIPVLKKSKGKQLTEFTHIEVGALSSDSMASINHISIAYGGLPLYKKLMAEGRVIFHDILFENNSYSINPLSFTAIDEIVSMLNENPNTFITLEGHTDANGSGESNQKLSEQRAEAVMYYIIKKGIDAKRLKSVGFGESRPLVEENTKEAWAKNRRVELVLQK